MISRRQAIALTGLAALPTLQTAVRAQVFPSKPITLLVGYPSSSIDQLMRILGAHLSQSLGQPVVVVNQPGVSGTMAPTNMARTGAPDGHTISFIPSVLMRLPHMQKVSYDPLNDFTFIIGLWTTTAGIQVRGDSPWQTLTELMAYARANPDKVSFGGVGTGTPGYFALQRIARQAGFTPTYVPFKGGPDLYGALLGGHLEVVIEGGFGPYLESGKVRSLAVLEAQRVRYWPNLPTAREQGFDAVVEAVGGIAGPKGMDPAIVRTLHDAIRRATEAPDFQKLLQSYGYPLRYMASDEYRAFQARAFVSEKKMLDESGFKPE